MFANNVTNNIALGSVKAIVIGLISGGKIINYGVAGAVSEISKALFSAMTRKIGRQAHWNIRKIKNMESWSSAAARITTVAAFAAFGFINPTGLTLMSALYLYDLYNDLRHRI